MKNNVNELQKRTKCIRAHKAWLHARYFVSQCALMLAPTVPPQILQSTWVSDLPLSLNPTMYQLNPLIPMIPMRENLIIIPPVIVYIKCIFFIIFLLHILIFCILYLVVHLIHSFVYKCSKNYVQIHINHIISRVLFSHCMLIIRLRF